MSRLSDKLKAALLDNSQAEVARVYSVDVLPGWVAGAKVFIHDICADDFNPSLIDMLKRSDVLMYEDDVCDLLRELKEDKNFPFKVRKVKALEGLPSLPEELSLMNMSSHGFTKSDAASVSSSGSSEIVVNVRNTFWEIGSALSSGRLCSAYSCSMSVQPAFFCLLEPCTSQLFALIEATVRDGCGGAGCFGRDLAIWLSADTASVPCVGVSQIVSEQFCAGQSQSTCFGYRGRV